MSTFVIESDQTEVIEITGFVGVGPTGSQGPAGKSGSPRVVTLAWAASVTIDWSVADIVRLTLQGNTTFTMTGANDGQKCALELSQDSVGSRSSTFGSEVAFGSDLTAFVPSTAANKRDVLGFIYDAAVGKYDFVALMRGF